MEKFSLLILLFFSACGQNDTPVYDIVIENVSLFNGNENLGTVNLAIGRDTIAHISKDKLKGDSIIDGSSKYIIPGLVNCHTHAWKLEDLQESYKAGVLTMVNLHQVNEPTDQKLRLYRDSIGFANFYSSGIAATAPEGHPTQYGQIETINEEVSPSEFVQNRIKNGADLIKIVRDSSAFPPDFVNTPTLSYTQIKGVIDEARNSGKKVVVHVQYLKDLLKVAELKPDGFAHMWFFQAELRQEDINRIKDSGVFIIPTVLTQKKILIYAEKDTTGFKDWALESFTPMVSIMNEIRQLYDAEIPLLAGTDPPNLGINYGDDLVEELLILRESGLPTEAVLQIATGNASRFLDIDGNGELKPGSKASFLVLNSDPTTNLHALKDIDAIWKNGKSK